MTAIDDARETEDPDLLASDVAWDVEPLVERAGADGVERLLDDADAIADRLETHRGRVATFDVAALGSFMSDLADLSDRLGRAGSYASLRFAIDTTDAEVGALMQRVQERSAALETRLLFFDLEWAALGDDHVERLLADPALSWCAHHLRSKRRYRDHLLTEPEERILTEKAVTGRRAWGRLFSELSSAITVEVPDPDTDPESGGTRTTKLEGALSLLADPDREVRRRAAEAVTEALQPGLRTRAFVFNTLLNDKAVDDRLRAYPTWLTSRNLANETSDESVQALVAAVKGRYDIARRWYRLKAQILGIERLADYDRLASVADSQAQIGWAEARDLVLDSYRSFSPRLADIARRFFDERWIDAPVRPGKRPGAFCSYTVASHHPYLMLNWTSRRRDVMTLAHELGHGLHAYLARDQGVFHQATPLTLAETASVFGETVAAGRMLDATSDPGERLALLAESIEGTIATVFRQTAMNQFEAAVHTARRTDGELAVERFGDLWAETQAEMLGDSVEITDGYRSWWSYVPHFIGTPGYVYAYAYGQLLALSVYARFQAEGNAFVPRYLDLLAAGGSMPPAELGRIVGCDLDDPGFWSSGLDIVEAQLAAAESAAHDAGRLDPST
ncbi:MAG: M3 family oligoendopeptidase [Acidimicrobiales bacterium]